MAADTGTAPSGFGDVPPSTAPGLALSLLALPGVAVLASALDVSLAPAVRIAIQWLVAAVVVGLALRDGSGAMAPSAGLAVAVASAVTTGRRGGAVPGVPGRTPVRRDGQSARGGRRHLGRVHPRARGGLAARQPPESAAAAGVLTAVYLRRRTFAPVVGVHVFVWVVAVIGRFYG